MKTVTPEQVEIRIPRRAEFVRLARATALALAGQLDFTYDVMKDVELAVGEACSNSVEHAAGDECVDVLVRFTIDPSRLVVEVIDRGPGFEFAPNEGGGDEGEKDPGGLGLTVIQAIMDELDVECTPDTGTCVRMVKYRKGQ